MFLLKGIISGIIATLIFDLYQFLLSYAYNINKPKWYLIGRYFLGLEKNKFVRENLEDEDKISNELIAGYFIHYFIGTIFGIFYVTLNIMIFNQPSFFLALFIGFFTVLGAWCILMPFAFNIGFFAIKKDEQKQILTQNLIAHFIFGVGLFIGYLIIN